jgi:hypothetical protein
MDHRKYIAAAAQKGEAIQKLGKMCGSCAFRLDSDANLEPHNVEAAIESLAFFGQFNCHKKPGEDAGRVCVGFLHAKQYFDKIDNEDNG